MEKYQKQLDRALNKVEELKNKGGDVKNISKNIEDNISKHIEVLQNNLEKVPEAGKEGIENAIENSSKVIEKFQEKNDLEKSCTDSGGTVSTSSCCKVVNDFPNLCAIGACGCSPADSKEVKICNCGENKCFNGKKCVSIGEQGEEQKEKNISFITVSKGYDSNYTQTEEKNYIIKNEDEWQYVKDLIKNTSSQQISSDIDFNKNIVIATFQGQKGSGGYSIEIIKVTESEDTVEVTILQTSPGATCGTTTVITSPYHIIKIPITTKNITFTVQRISTQCSH